MLGAMTIFQKSLSSRRERNVVCVALHQLGELLQLVLLQAVRTGTCIKDL